MRQLFVYCAVEISRVERKVDDMQRSGLERLLVALPFGMRIYLVSLRPDIGDESAS